MISVGCFVFGCASSECADGLEPIDGICRDDCGGCPEGQFCDTSTSPDQCRCPAGYSGDPCRFSDEGLIANPSFDAPSSTAWVDEAQRGAVVLRGLVFADTGEVGVGLIDGDAVCDAASLTQVVRMPSFEFTGEALVAEVEYQAIHVHGLAIGFDRAWTRLRPTSAEPGSGNAEPQENPDELASCDSPANECEIATESFCIGEAAYGRPPYESDVVVRIGAAERLASCDDPEAPEARIAINHFSIRPATGTECTDPATGERFAFGDVLNGSANLQGGGWRFDTATDVEGALSANAGINDLSGARLFRPANVEGGGSMTTKVSVPLPADFPSPALRFSYRGTFPERYEVKLGTWLGRDDPGRQVDTLVGTGGFAPAIYCLPPWTHGHELDLSFQFASDSAETDSELVIDDVELVSDECGDATDLLDPSFDTDNRWFGASIGNFLEQVRPESRNGPSDDDSENRFLELVYGPNQADISMETYVLVPRSDDAGGPAIFFRAATPEPTSATVRWLRGLEADLAAEFFPSSSFETFAACLPPAWAGRWYRVRIAVGPDAWSGATMQERLLLDDFELGTSPECDAE